MPSIFICKAPSWAVLMEQSHEWLKNGAEPALFMTPPEWKRMTRSDGLQNALLFSPDDFLDEYIRQKHGVHLLQTRNIASLLSSIITRDGTKYLNIENHRSGYVRALAELIGDFRKNFDGSLQSVLSDGGARALSAKERDLIDIHDEWETLLLRRKLYDYRRAVLDFVNDGGIQALPLFERIKGRVLTIAGYSHMSGMDGVLYESLIGLFDQTILLRIENENASRLVFRKQRSLDEFVARLSGKRFSISEMRIRPHEEALLPLAQSIFGGTPSAIPSKCKVRIFSANSRYEEVTGIARRIRALMDEGMPPSDFRLVTPDYELYVAIIMEVFPRYGIRFVADQGIPFLFFPLARLMGDLAVHAIAPNPYPIRERIFSSPYVSFSCSVEPNALFEMIPHPDEIPFLEKETILSLFKEPKNQTLDFESINRLRKNAMKASGRGWKTDPLKETLSFVSDTYEKEGETRSKKLLETLLGFHVLKEAEKALYASRPKESPSDFIHAMRMLIGTFGIRENVAKSESTLNEPSSIPRQDRAVLRGIDSLFDGFERDFSSLAPSDDDRLPLSDLVYGFIGLMSETECGVSFGESDGVLVCAAGAAHASFKPVTFLCGLVDGSFPSQETFNFLKRRKEGRDIFMQHSAVDECRERLYQIVASTKRELFLSYPGFDCGRRLKTSPYVEEVKKCVTGLSYPREEESDAVYSTREKLESIARGVDRYSVQSQELLDGLKNIDPDFYRQIRGVLVTDGCRSRLDSFTRFDGTIGHEPAVTLIQAQVADPGQGSPWSAEGMEARKADPGQGSPWSAEGMEARKADPSFFTVERLERYARCPLRFLFDDLAELKDPLVPDYHPDRTELGKLVRSVLIHYTEKAAGAGPVPDVAERIIHEAALKEMGKTDGVKVDLFSRMAQKGLVAGLVENDDTRKGKPGLFKAFLEYERECPDRLLPYMAGLSVEKRIGEIVLVVDMDRIDKTSNGKYLIIYSYTTSDYEDVAAVHKGLSFKLPMQVLALRDYTGRTPGEAKVGGAGTIVVKNRRNIKRGGYFALRELQASRRDGVTDGKPLFSGQRRFGFLDSQGFERLLEETSRRVNRIRELVLEGRFNPPLCAQQDQPCVNCQFARICRMDQLRCDALYKILDAHDVYKPLRAVEG